MEDQKYVPVHPITGEAKRCFISEGFWICNFVVRKNGLIVFRKAGGCLRFFANSGWRAEKKKKEEIVNNLKNEKIPAPTKQEGSVR